jgi:hypothetical protein
MIYRRIEIGPVSRPRVDQRDVVEAPPSYSPAYADAVWQAVQATARGVNPPVVVGVDQSGWESA